MNSEKVLESLCLSAGPSGYEQDTARVFARELEKYAQDVHVDRMGNVIGKIEGSDKSSPAVMIYAHLDQLGFIVRKIEDDGFIQVDRMGGIPEKVLPALKLKIRTVNGKFVSGIFGNKSHHASSAEDKYKVDLVTSLFIDVGAGTAEEVRAKGIDIGCPVIYEPSFEMLSEKTACGTALDDRGGLLAALVAAEILSKKQPASTVYICGTVWEEFNLRGALYIARAYNPGVAIGLDVALAGDTHDLSSRYEDMLGKGPTVNYYCFHGRGTLNGVLPHEGLVNLAEKVAEEKLIPHQRFASLGIITETAYVQLEHSGIVCCDMGFPARYTHTPVEVCCIDDIENLGKLSAETALAINKEFNLNRYEI